MKGVAQASKLQSLYLNPGHLTEELEVTEPFHLAQLGQVPFCSESLKFALPSTVHGVRKMSSACLRVRFSYK